MWVHPQFDPVALSLGPVQIHWYGLTYLAAFGLFLFLGARRVQRPQYASIGWTRPKPTRRKITMPKAVGRSKRIDWPMRFANLNWLLASIPPRPNTMPR